MLLVEAEKCNIYGLALFFLGYSIRFGISDGFFSHKLIPPRIPNRDSQQEGHFQHGYMLFGTRECLLESCISSYFYHVFLIHCKIRNTAAVE